MRYHSLIAEARADMAAYLSLAEYCRQAGSPIACNVYKRAAERMRRYLVREGAKP